MGTSGSSRTAAWAATGLSLTLLLGACTSPAPAPSTSPSGSESPTATATASSATPTPAPSLTGAATAPVVRPPGDEGFGLLTAVRLSGHEGYDRFVLEFRDAVPGYRVAYTSKPVTADPSDEVVEVAGSAVLWIRMEPASGWDLVSAPDTPTYTGPERVAGDTLRVREAVRTGDFEAVLSWVLGIDGTAPFLVTELSDPPRLVVDVATSG